MKVSVLERLLQVERHRRRIGESDIVPPVVANFPSTYQEAPWVTSLSRGSFTITRLNSEGYVGQAFVECPPDEEDLLLRNLFHNLWALSERHSWANRSSLAKAPGLMRSLGMEPKALVVPYSMIHEIVGGELSEDEADKLTFMKGCVAEVDGVRVISAGTALPAGTAILAAEPPKVGRYTRINDHVAVTLIQADRSVVLVRDALA